MEDLEEAQRATTVIRKNLRDMLIDKRHSCRNKEHDDRRLLQNPNDNPTVLQIANTLKTKSAVSLEELSVLKNSFAEDLHNIEIFLKVNGALRGLVREFTGHSVSKQLCAAACICNLSVAFPSKLARDTAPYLVHTLDSFNEELAVVSAWSLGNMLGSEEGLPYARDALPALLRLVLRPAPRRDAAAHALTHCALALGDQLGVEHLQLAINTLTKLDVSKDTAHLMFILSCHPQFINTIKYNHNFTDTLCQSFIPLMEAHNLKCNNVKFNELICCEFVYVLRIVANVCANPEHCNKVLNYFNSKECYVPLKSFLEVYSGIYETVMWLLGNIYNYATDLEVKNSFFLRFIS